MKDMYPLRYNKNVLTGPFIIQTVNEVTGGDAVIVTEVGQHQMWAPSITNTVSLEPSYFRWTGNHGIWPGRFYWC